MTDNATTTVESDSLTRHLVSDNTEELDEEEDESDDSFNLSVIFYRRCFFIHDDFRLDQMKKPVEMKQKNTEVKMMVKKENLIKQFRFKNCKKE